MSDPRRNDIGGKAVISICILVIAGLFSWFISASWGQGIKAQDGVERVEKEVYEVKTVVAVHAQKFITFEKQIDTVIIQQNSMEDKIDMLLAK